MPTYLVAADIGNVNTKYRRRAQQWIIEPSVVRSPAGAAFSFTNEAPPRPLRYRSGPAAITDAPYLVGQDAVRGGVGDMAIMGSGEIRVHSDPYLLLHFFSILDALPEGVREAEVVFAGGLPQADHARPAVQETLKRRLIGTHHLSWGELDYHVSIRDALILPQPVAAIATLLFSAEGQPLGNGALQRVRLGLDVGGGTTDYTGRQGIKLLPGTEGGVRIGIQNAAEIARTLIQQRFPQLSQLRVQEILHAMRTKELVVFVGGEPKSIAEEVAKANAQVVSEILADVLPKWEPYLAQGEVVIFGGGGSDLAGPIGKALGRATRVTLLENPVVRVVDGIERIARSRFNA
jgi:hypothetical protein